MPTIPALGGERYPNTARLSNAQTGDGASTNIVDRGAATERPALLTITTTVGATPTCTYAIEGSADGASWFAVFYAETATPDTGSVATFDITTATTTRKILRADQPWRYLRLTYSANTNVTNTADVAVF
ncbi:hypothetical protein [Streptomyces sp. AMCC400023]|uniref:hypothetical protein n=1 Tax=Streptomyces sp. AMCC400023 TaxID=2056258 RepID=UPI001F33EA4C|nr:hypothetical protein [Streptomyces sp. AMCC400023]UJV41620.1 hypothetical protein CVT30_18740 [Streptomyces sp. AMCC400023]